MIPLRSSLGDHLTISRRINFPFKPVDSRYISHMNNPCMPFPPFEKFHEFCISFISQGFPNGWPSIIRLTLHPLLTAFEWIGDMQLGFHHMVVPKKRFIHCFPYMSCLETGIHCFSYLLDINTVATGVHNNFYRRIATSSCDSVKG